MRSVRNHQYTVTIQWTGNLGTGTSAYTAYSRDHLLFASTKAVSVPMSSEPVFRGDMSRYSPEELLLASLSSCHMLWFLHVCSDAKVTVLEYTDQPTGVMVESEDGSGEFRHVVLCPRVRITEEERESELESLHQQAHDKCFIARSVRFPVTIELK
ncbi:MAG: OsmC family protein [Bryobacteraceae bacterium]|nr:OsmC family protein [Bryobacteraceae bacterium]